MVTGVVVVKHRLPFSGCPACATLADHNGKSVIFVIVKGYDMSFFPILLTIIAGGALAIATYKLSLFLGNIILSEEESD